MKNIEKINSCKDIIEKKNIGDTIICKLGRELKVTDKTKTSIQLYITKINKKGINYNQWYDAERLVNLLYN